MCINSASGKITENSWTLITVTSKQSFGADLQQAGNLCFQRNLLNVTEGDWLFKLCFNATLKVVLVKCHCSVIKDSARNTMLRMKPWSIPSAGCDKAAFVVQYFTYLNELMDNINPKYPDTVPEGPRIVLDHFTLLLCYLQSNGFWVIRKNQRPEKKKWHQRHIQGWLHRQLCPSCYSLYLLQPVTLISYPYLHTTSHRENIQITSYHREEEI